jgi:hypothetical protein
LRIFCIDLWYHYKQNYIRGRWRAIKSYKPSVNRQRFHIQECCKCNHARVYKLSEKKKKLLICNIDQQQQGLKAHLERQARCVSIAIFPWTLLIFSFEYLKNLSISTDAYGVTRAKRIREVDEFLYQSYLLGTPRKCEKFIPKTQNRALGA